MLTIATKQVKIESYSFWKAGKKTTVPAHTRTIRDSRVKVTAKEYRDRFQERPIQAQEGDIRRRSKNVISGKSALLPANFQTNKFDWEGIDAKSYPKISPKQVVGTLTGGMPSPDYSILKYTVLTKTNEKVAKYRPMFKGKPIGTVTPYGTPKAAQKVCLQHHGRATGQIKNTNWADEFNEKMNKTKRYDYRKELGIGAHFSERDSAYDDEMEDDHSVNKHERADDRAFRRSMKGIHMFDKGY